MATWEFIDRDGTLSCTRCLAGLKDGKIVHLAGCRAAGVSAGDYEVDLIINLKDQGLVHADGSDCGCSGDHDLTVAVDLEAHELHADYQCEVPALTAQAVQRLHELAHPEGAVYAENCREPECQAALLETY
jgi:hypothetical protein